MRGPIYPIFYLLRGDYRLRFMASSERGYHYTLPQSWKFTDPIVTTHRLRKKD